MNSLRANLSALRSHSGWYSTGLPGPSVWRSVQRVFWYRYHGAVVDAFPEVDAELEVALLPFVEGLVVEVVVHGFGGDVLG